MTTPPIVCILRQRRTQAGLSQNALAQRVGASRQAIIAIEAGRQVPSTTLALQLAKALACTVEDLFTLPPDDALTATLAPSRVDRGDRVALGRVDGAWIAHRLTDGASPGDGLIKPAPHTLDHVSVEPLAAIDDLEKNVLVAGCAPLLGVLAGRLGRRSGASRATWIGANSAIALDLLAQGMVHVAGLHLVEAQTPGGHEALVRDRFPNRATTIVNLTRWRQGLVVAPGNPLAIHGVQDALREDVRFVHREPGSGAWTLLQRLLPAVPVPGPQAGGHAEVVQLIRWGVADVGIAIEAAALAQGLDFIPLSEERFDLLVPQSRLHTEPIARLLDLIDRPAFRAEAAHLPGYDLSTSGHATTVAAQGSAV